MIWKKNVVSKRCGALDADGDEPATISISTNAPSVTQANRIYFYGDINTDSILELNKQLDESIKQMQIIRVTLELPKPPPIKLHINSRGGDVAAALCVADKIQRSTVPIYTVCEGEIASGATLISVFGHKRFMTKHSFFLIHQLSSEFWGKYMELEDEMKNLNMMMDVIKDVYLSKTKIPEKELDELLKRDLYISPEKCLAWEIVDDII